jgi:hypothetical protein
MNFEELQAAILRQRESRAARVKDYELNKAVYEDGEPEEISNGTAHENTDRSTEPVE